MEEDQENWENRDYEKKIYLFAKGERDIFIFDHVWYLPPHGESEQHHPVK